MIKTSIIQKAIVAGLLLILCVPPTCLLIKKSVRNGGVIGLIHFGADFQDSVLPEIKALAPRPVSPQGYDAQFYASMALYPGLLDSDGNPVADTYRAKRIGLPALAFCLGAGRPAWILHVYALLNAGFWLILLAALIRYTGFRRPRDLFLACALLWSTGTLVSLSRALTDFPAVALGTLAVLCFRSRPLISALLLSASGLIREASAFCFAAIPWDGSFRLRSLKKLIVPGLILCLPLLLWTAYVHAQLADVPATRYDNFNFPFFGIVLKIVDSLQELIAQGPARNGRRLFEFLCPLSLLAQTLYLVVKPRWRTEIWRFGIGFVVLLSLLGGDVWTEQNGYPRIFLPLTFTFNLLIHRHESGWRLGLWYLLGNGGMLWMLRMAL